jgi:glycosyltransferase involved in cell wall biosynthesis
LQVFLQLLPFIGEQPDVLHFEWNSAAVEYLPLFDFFTCPSVISCRGAQVQVAPANPSRQSFVDGMRLSFQKTSAIHCVSEAILEEIQVYGADPRKSKVIRPAVDPAEFEPPAQARTQAGPVQMVSTGSLIWRKGYEYALIAMKLLKLRGHDFCFQIIGDGPDYQRLFFTLRDLELEENVRLVGKLKPADVRTTLQQADIFVLSSLSEGISNAVLEAMASGLPVVTTDSGGMAEAVDDGVEGFLVPPRDPNAMADALEILIRDRDLRVRMAAAARDRFLRQFTLQRQIDEYLDLYNSLCNGHQQAGR